MDYEDLANLSNSTDVPPDYSKEYLAQEIIFSLISLVAICADAFIIHIVFRYKRMRTVPNIFLANWAIADLCSLIVSPSGYRILSVLDHFTIPYEFLCFLLELGGAFHFTTLLYMLLLAFDWCFARYFEKFSEKFRYYYKFVLGSIWLIAFLLASVGTGLCITDHFFSLHLVFFLFTGYLAVFGVVVILQISRAIHKCRGKFLDYPNLMLNIVTVSAICWFLTFLCSFIFGTFGVFHPLLGLVGMCMVFCTSIINFTILYRQSKDFQACLLQVLRRSKIEYEEADFVFHNPVSNKPIVKNNKVQVLFKKEQELVENVY